MKYLFALPILFVLTACGGAGDARPEPIVVPVEVLTPVPAACVPDTLAPPPQYVDTDPVLRAAADAAERYQLVLAGRGQRIARLNEVEPIVAACPRGKSK